MVIPTTLQAEELSVLFQNIVDQGGQIDTYFEFAGHISYNTIDAIRNGITARLVITFQLAKSGGVFGSVKNVIRERIETFNLTYDVWENSFKVLDKNRDAEYLATSSSDILSKIQDAVNPVTMSMASIKADEKLVVRVKIKIQTIKLYPPFGIFLFFFDPWNYESSWLYSDVFTVEKS
jgi:hypothetical protein